MNKQANKSFQKELWEEIWSKNSFTSLVNQLKVNPIYWRLKSKLKPRDKILEAGCGFGQWVWALQQQGYKITGVDIAQNTIKKLKQMFPKLDLKIADVEKLPFGDSNFDVYLSFGVIEHFPKGPQVVLREAKRVLKPKGLLFLTVPYLNIPRLIRFGLWTKKTGNFYQYLYSESDIKKRISENGFKIRTALHYDFVNAIKKDVPPLGRLIDLKFKSSKFPKIIKNPPDPKQWIKPKFLLQKLFYLLDSYILLIEADNNK